MTRRELEVAELVARGLTDREFAAEVVIARRTVESRVQHIHDEDGIQITLSDSRLDGDGKGSDEVRSI